MTKIALDTLLIISLYGIALSICLAVKLELGGLISVFQGIIASVGGIFSLAGQGTGLSFSMFQTLS